MFDDRWVPEIRLLAAGVDHRGRLEVEPDADHRRASASRLAGCDLVVPSPGVPVGHPIYAAALEAGVPVRSELELAAEIVDRAGTPRLAAVTGTNGKTTVTTLATAMLQASGVHAMAAGNIGTPMVEAVTSGAEVIVAEVSSFQLQFTQQFRPDVSCWLNLAPDHLDWHPTLDHYADAKAKIWANQGAGDTAVVNADDAAVAACCGSPVDTGWCRSGGTPSPATRVSSGSRVTSRSQVSSGQGRAAFAVDGDRLAGPDGDTLATIAELPRALPHDLSNALAAAAVALSVGATKAGCRVGLISAPLLPHRVTFVGESGGVRWYDDSKATTPASVVAAVTGFASVVLIAGGRNKGLDLAALASNRAARPCGRRHR